ncbi:uncharacterized protein LOC126891436 [Diabrotica virgifera virgifera]|uniref:Tc1-like transposase DDE domain-containing protein n=1 Tax=Diabrotica virgifera virgifera TaxID=50390 RepID=A0ABM5L299_DIAVI|nr:uncharacterized protein LOC126891436 [Diabrotica virgifera virgifera]
MSITSARQAHVEGLSTGLKHPSGKGKRLIVLHIGSKDGFVDNGLLLFESKKTGDYHEDMNSDVFEQWLQRILPTLPQNAVIVLDNAAYHSRKYEKMPTSATRKADIQSWLRQNNIPYTDDMVKAELLALVKNNPIEQNYVVDEMVKLTGRCVLRLPPYHCELNPIELIWTQVKGEVARKNSTYKIPDVKVLFNQALSNVTANNWQNAVNHVDGIISKMWQLDFIIERVIEPIIINLGNDSSSSEDSDSD